VWGRRVGRESEDVWGVGITLSKFNTSHVKSANKLANILYIKKSTIK
jgi:hypothetical protein